MLSSVTEQKYDTYLLMNGSYGVLLCAMGVVKMADNYIKTKEVK